MRPVNLVPSDQRGTATLRTDAVGYLIVGALALVLVGVTMLVLTNNKIADRHSTIADLHRQQAAAQAQAAQLQPFVSFKQTEGQRIKAIRDLADSRIDWNRVMQELARILPADVRLNDLTASASGSADGSTSTTGTATSSGPSLKMAGCAGGGHESVAAFIASLHDIDGVTNVDLQTSTKAGSSSTTAGSTGSTTSTGAGASEGCTGDSASFQLIASFGSPAGSSSSATASAIPSQTVSSTTPAPATGTQTPPAPASPTDVSRTPPGG
jgi:Tfp pilus assembly protein PilN